ncbi:unnamed protein product [Penicillium olsonii]|nr:unnamed protein product [Penicillium olsonii]
MAAPLHVQFLYGPAEIALKTILSLRIESLPLLELSPEKPSEDARKLLDLCNTFRSGRSQKVCLDLYLGNILLDLSYDTVLMLALMTWHFDASSSEASPGLINFLKLPYESVKRMLQEKYRRMSGTKSSDFDFSLILN